VIPRGRVRLATTVTLLSGLVGSSLVAMGGSLHARLARTPGTRFLAALEQATWSRPVGYVLTFTGLVVLTGAWLLLGREVRGRREGVGRVLRATALWVVPLLLTPPLFSNDAWSYVAEGDLVAQHRSPYVFTPLDLSGPIVQAVGRTWVNVAAPYGPLPLMWGGLWSGVSTNPWFGLVGFRVLALLGLTLLALGVVRLARHTGRDPASAAWLAIACPYTLVHGVGGAHLDLTMAGLLALAVLSSLRGRWILGSVLVGAAAAVKAPALVADVAIVLAGVSQAGLVVGSVLDRFRRGVVVVAVSLATLFGLGLVSGLGSGWVAGLMTPLQHRSPLSPTTEIAVHVGEILGVQLVTPVHVLAVVVLVLTLAWVAVRAPVRSSADVVRYAAMVTSATVLLSPVVHYWYFFWCLPFLAAAVLSHRLRRGTFWLVLALGLLAPADFSAGHLPFSAALVALGLGAAVAGALFPQDMGRRRREQGARRAGS
jgi:hypothetical protein